MHDMYITTNTTNTTNMPIISRSISLIGLKRVMVAETLLHSAVPPQNVFGLTFPAPPQYGGFLRNAVV